MVRSSSRPRVSVIIPAYNSENFIDQTLRSVRAQTFRKIEIIVVNDGSTDRTAQIAQAHATADSRIQIISKANEGVAAARNDGIGVARGEYVAFLDADDLWHPTKIARQVAAIELPRNDTPYAAVYTLSREIDAQDRIIRSNIFYPIDGNGFARHVFARPVGNGSNIMVRRHVALAVGGFDASYQQRGLWGVEDFDFEVKIAANYPMKAIAEYLVGYRKHDQNMSADSIRMALATMDLYNRYLGGRQNRMRQGKAWVYGMLHYELFCHYALGSRPIDALGGLTLAAINDPEYLWIKLSSAAMHFLRTRLSKQIPAKPGKWIIDSGHRYFYDARVDEPSNHIPLAYLKRRYEYLYRVDKRHDNSHTQTSDIAKLKQDTIAGARDYIF